VRGAERTVPVTGERHADLRVTECEAAERRTTLVVTVTDPARPSLDEYARELRYVYAARYERGLVERIDPLVVEQRFERAGDRAVRVRVEVDAVSARWVEVALNRLAATVRRYHEPFHRRARRAYRERAGDYVDGPASAFDLVEEFDPRTFPDGFDANDAAEYVAEYFEWRLTGAGDSDRDRTERTPATPLRSTPLG
jgi:hypothetical protein